LAKSQYITVGILFFSNSFERYKILLVNTQYLLTQSILATRYTLNDGP